MSTEDQMNEYIDKVKALGAHEYKGILCLPDMKASVQEWMENDLKLEEGDIVIITPPCAGIQWLQESLYLLRHPEKIDSGEKKELATRVFFLDRVHRDISPQEFMSTEQPPRLFKTHRPAEYLAKHIDEGKAKFIFWSLDPRKCMAQFHHHLDFLGPRWLNLPPLPWPVYWKMIQTKNMYEGDYFDFVKGYLPYLDRPNVQFRTFEDSSTDPVGTLKEVAEFCGFDHSEEVLTKIANARKMDQPPDPKKKFTEEQLKEFEDWYKEKLAGTRFEGLY